MMPWFWYGLAGAIALWAAGLVAWCLCRAASDADEAIDGWSHDDD